MRLATFNILNGRSPDDGAVGLDRLRRAVRDLDPDILALQEVDRDQPRSHRADLTLIAAEEMGAVSHRFAAALSGTPGAAWRAATEQDGPGRASYGVALLSRYPAHDWQVLRLPRIRPPLPRWLAEPRKMILVREEPRVVVVARLDTPGGPLTVASTHLSFVPGQGRRQLRRITRDLAAVPEPVVIMGDLNMSGELARRVTGYSPLAEHPTFPVEDPTDQLDHILIRGRLGPVEMSCAPRYDLSDHRALLVEVDARPGP